MKELMMEKKQGLIYLRPICVELFALIVSENTRDKSDEFQRLSEELVVTISTLESDEVQSCIEFILVPILGGLASPLDTVEKFNSISHKLLDVQLESLFQIILAIVEKCGSSFCRSRTDVFLEICLRCIYVISPSKENPQKEETICLALEVIEKLFHELSNDTKQTSERWNKIYDGLLAQISVALLDCLHQQVKSRERRLKCLNAIRSMVGTIDRGHVLQFLPGLTTGLVKVMLEDYKSGSVVRNRSAETWKLCLIRVFSTDEIRPNPPELQKIGEKLLPILTRVMETDLDLFPFGLDMIKLCHAQLLQVDRGKEMISVFVMMLASSSMNPKYDGGIRESKCVETISILKQLPGNPWASTICTLLDVHLQQLLRTMPSYARSSDSQQFKLALHRSIGLIDLLGDRVEVTLDSWSEVFIQHLAMVVEFSRDRYEAAPRIRELLDGKGETTMFPRHDFEHIRERDTILTVQTMLRKLGESSEAFKLNILARIFATTTMGELENDHPIQQALPEKLFIANWVLQGRSERSPSQDAAKLCLQGSLVILKMTTSMEGGSKETDLVVAMALELVGTVFEVQQNVVKSKRWLVDVLFPVLQYVPSPNNIVKDSAVGCLQVIASSCGYMGAQDLLQSNMDYIIDATMYRLDDLFDYPETPHVLQAMMEILCTTKALTNPDVEFYVKDMVFAVLEAIDKVQKTEDSLILELFRILKLALQFTLTDGPRERFPSLENLISIHAKRTDYVGDLIDEMKAVDEQMKETDKDDGEEDDEVEKDDESDPTLNDLGPKVDEQNPIGIILSKEILQRSRHFVLHGSVFTRRMVLETIELGILNMQDDETHLLPMINDIWGSLIHHLNGEGADVILQPSIQVAKRCISVAPEFVARRFVTSLWPFLRRKLIDSRNHAKLQTSSRISTELEVSILECVHEVIVRCDHVDTRTLLAIGETTGRFLDKAETRQEVQDLSLQLWRSLLKRNPDLFWLHVMQTDDKHSCLPRDMNEQQRESLVNTIRN